MKELYILLLSAILYGCYGSGKDLPFYKLDVKIDPREQHLESSLQCNYIHPQATADSIVFLLYKYFAIQSLEGENIRDYHFDTTSASPFPFTPKAGRLVLRLKKPMAQDERINFSIKYAGNIEPDSDWKINRITEDWVELGMYAPWFPFNPELKDLAFEVGVKTAGDYKVVGNGSVYNKNGSWQITNNMAGNDIIIAASREMKQIEASGDDFSLHLYSAAGTEDSTMHDILAANQIIFKNYIKWFGKTPGPSSLSILITPRETNGGYARKGLIVLSKLNDKYYFRAKPGYMVYFAHELAHLWWLNAPVDSWEDWLNESFAEYSALISLREVLGESEFASRIKKKAEGIEALPAIRGIKRNDDMAYQVLYNKGCYYLYELEQEIGRGKFLQLMRLIFTNRVNSTDRFLEILSSNYGQQAAARFNDKLNR